MGKMNAAVVTSFGEPPHYQQFEVPRPAGGETLVDVLAVGLHPRTRTGSAGAHYTSTGTLPMIPGIDGVARRPDGKRIYFVAADDAIGTLADKAVADVRRSIELPDGVDVAKVAAGMNPAMSRPDRSPWPPAPSREGAAEGPVLVPARVRKSRRRSILTVTCRNMNLVADQEPHHHLVSQ
jgi:NADPH:quinone reductase-like Zn-dependent oxidoreductase